MSLFVPESQSSIAFNEIGDRLNVAYDIYNQQAEDEVVIVGSLVRYLPGALRDNKF